MSRDLRFRTYDPADGPSVVALWDGAMGSAYPLRAQVLRQVTELNPSFRPEDGTTVWAGDRLVGFGLMQRYRGDAPRCRGLLGRAWLAAVVVAPEAQRRGLGTRIYERLRRLAPVVPLDHVRPGGGVHYFFPGAPLDLAAAGPFLASLGFHLGDRTYDLRTEFCPTVPLAAAAATLPGRGLRVEPCRPADVGRLLDLLASDFSVDWWHDADWFFRRGGAPADWLLLWHGDELLGLARTHHARSALIGPPLYWVDPREATHGGLGPIGVGAAVRHQGLGSALLGATLARLHGLGAEDAVADWTDLFGFYDQAGFHPWKRYATPSP